MNDTLKLCRALAGLSDSMKRLERAISCDNMDDRAEYLKQAKQKRESAEKFLMRIARETPK